MKKWLIPAAAMLMIFAQAGTSAAMDVHAESAVTETVISYDYWTGEKTTEQLAVRARAETSIPKIERYYGAGISAAEDDSDLLLDCNDRAGYDHLGTLPNGEKMQALYDDMYDTAVALWYDTSASLTDTGRSDGWVRYGTLDVDGLTFKEECSVYFSFRNDNPLFYFVGAKASASGDSKKFYMLTDPEYTNGSKRAETQEKIISYIADTAKKVENETTVYGKAKAIHDIVMEDVEYAHDSSGNPEKSGWAHNVAGAAERNSGVCETYAFTFQMMMNYLDVENYFLAGVATNLSGHTEGHAWNMVRFDDGEYYYIDCTWDDGLDNGYTYFARGSTFMDAHRTRGSLDDSSHTMIELPDANADDFDAFPFECSSRSGYDHLGTLPKAQLMQKLYGDMQKAAIDLWYDTEQVVPDRGERSCYGQLPVEGLDFSEMCIVYNAFKNDNPALYFVGSTMASTANNDYYLMYTDSAYKYGSERAELQQKLETYVTSFAENAKNCATAYEKARSVYDHLAANTKDYQLPDGADAYPYWAHTIEGVVSKGSALSTGYARAFQMMMTYLGAESYYVIGSVGSESTGYAFHAWDLVRLDDGSFYYIDCDFGDRTSNDIYFAFGSSTMKTINYTPNGQEDTANYLIPLPTAGEKAFDTCLYDWSSSSGFDYLGTLPKAEKLQQLYIELKKASFSLWYDTSTTYTVNNGLFAILTERISGLDKDDINKVYYTFCDDHPAFYFANDFGWNYIIDTGELTRFILYADASYKDGKSRASIQSKTISYMNTLMSKVPVTGSDHDKVCAVHDAINANMTLAVNSSNVFSSEIWAGNIVGAVEKGKGRSDSYAKIFQMAMNKLGIESYIVKGAVYHKNALISGFQWNMVRLDDGKYYYVDCAMDDWDGGRAYLAKGSKGSNHAEYKSTYTGNQFQMDIPSVSENDYNNAGGIAVGDVNGDGKVNVTDVSMLAAHIKNVRLLSGDKLLRADMNADGRVNITDLSKLAAIVKGIA